MSLLYFILIGIFTGWLVGYIVKDGGYGLVGNFYMVLFCALLAGFVFGQISASAGEDYLAILLAR